MRGDSLLERDEELAALEGRLAETRGRAGGVVVIEAAAGMGKSRLLTIACELARDAEMHVLSAQGTELEREFPFGVALQLLERRWLAADPDERARLSSGSARWAGDLLAGDMAGGAEMSRERENAAIHGLFRFACNLAGASAEERSSSPVVMAVDDAHLADGPSLRFLAYLARRIADVPILVIFTVRTGDGATDQSALTALRTAADRPLVRPHALSDDAVAMIARAQFRDAEPTFCQACARVTGGNPFLLVELLNHLAAEGMRADASTADRLSELVPANVLTAVGRRLEALEPRTRAFVAATAILGERASLIRAARLADLDITSAAEIAHELSAINLLQHGEGLSFVDPLTGASVRAAISPYERGELHRHAAAILSQERLPDEQVAFHLLEAPPRADPQAIELLRRLAEKALADGALGIAVKLLERALAEGPSPQEYPRLIAELGVAESSAGLPGAVERLEHAIRVTEERPRRAQLALIQAKALYDRKHYRAATDVIERAAAELSDTDTALAKDLDAAFVATATFVPDLASEVSRRGWELVADERGEHTLAQRVAIAHLALHQSIRGTERADVRHLAELAWENGTLLDAGTVTCSLLSRALMIVDDIERGLEICEAALEVAKPQEPAVASPVACCCRAWSRYEQGRIVEAVTDAKAALSARSDDWDPYVKTAYGAIVSCQLQRAQLEQAEVALSIIDHPDVQAASPLALLLDARARLRLQQHRPREALEDALNAGQSLVNEFSVDTPGLVAWRSTAALAYLSLGDSSRARDLAEEELAHARQIGIPRVVIRDLRILGLASRGPAGLELLTEAARTGENYPVRLEYIHALTDLGAALRRTNRRAAAREPLRIAVELSQRGGVSGPYERARTELASSGARPRRVMLSGVDSLTPSERRVGEFAARGLTTRQIAGTLFITPKGVEFHLRQIYQKLGISSRADLKNALTAGESDEFEN